MVLDLILCVVDRFECHTARRPVFVLLGYFLNRELRRELRVGSGDLTVFGDVRIIVDPYESHTLGPYPSSLDAVSLAGHESLDMF